MAYDAVVAAANGTIKGISLSDSSFTNLNDVESVLPDTDSVSRIAWSSEDETGILCALLDRRLRLFDPTTSDTEELFTLEDGEGVVTGLERVDGDRLFTCVESGAVRVWDLSPEKRKKNNDMEKTPVKNHAAVSIQSGTNSRRMRASPVKLSMLATGGHGDRNKLRLWDVEKPEQPVFTMKNVGEDALRLQVPICVNDLRFVPDTELVTTCTANHRIRLFDPRAQRKPTRDIQWGEDALTAIDTVHAHQAIVGSNKGNMALIDWRSPGSAVQCYRGYAGAIRDLNYHRDSSMVIGCGTDRFVIVHDVKTRKQLHKIYCKSRLNCVLLKSTLPSLQCKQENGEKEAECSHRVKDEVCVDSDQDDDLWQDMGRVGQDAGGRKRRLEADDSSNQKKMAIAARIRRKRTSEASDTTPTELLGSPRKRGKLEPRRKRAVEQPKGEDKRSKLDPRFGRKRRIPSE